MCPRAYIATCRRTLLNCIKVYRIISGLTVRGRLQVRLLSILKMPLSRSWLPSTAGDTLLHGPSQPGVGGTSLRLPMRREQMPPLAEQGGVRFANHTNVLPVSRKASLDAATVVTFQKPEHRNTYKMCNVSPIALQHSESQKRRTYEKGFASIPKAYATALLIGHDAGDSQASIVHSGCTA